MSYEAIQLTIFVLMALISGIALGWWFSALSWRDDEKKKSTELTELRSQYEQAVYENNRLRKQLKQTERNRAKAVSLLEDSNDYGYLVQTRKESEQHLQKLQQQEEHIVRLTSMLNSIQSESGATIGAGIDLDLPPPPQPDSEQSR